MKNIGLAILTIIATLTLGLSFAAPVHAQGLFTDPKNEELPVATPDAQLKSVLPLVYSDNSISSVSKPEDSDLFANPLVGASIPAPVLTTVTSSPDATMPIASDDMIGISTYFSTFHPGIDLRAKVGTTIHAILAGTVSTVGYEPGGYGRFVILTHHAGDQTLFSLYAHMKEINVTIGDALTSGQAIGEVGLTGHTTGPHLHFEIHTAQAAMDPLKFFTSKSLAMAKN